MVRQMSYHRFNNLSKLLNGDLTTKIGQGILTCELNPESGVQMFSNIMTVPKLP